MNVDADKYNYITTPIDSLVGFNIRYIVGGIPNRIRIAIEVDEYTTIDHIRIGWEDILQHREELEKIQGSDLSINYDVVLYELSKLRKPGFGYGQIAKFLNYHIVASLCKAHHDIETGELEDERAGFGWYGFSTIFVAMGFNERKLDEWYRDGISEIRKGKAPWTLHNGPFDTNKVRYHLDYFEKRFSKGSITIGEHYLVNNSFDVERAYLFLNGWYEAANGLLHRTDRTYWDKQKKWIMVRLREINSMIEESKSPIIQTLRVRRI